MFERLNNDDISSAIDELVAVLGVKEQKSTHDLNALLRNRNAEGCVQEIASQLGLPVRVDLSYVSEDSVLDDADRFSTTALAQPGHTGRIIAQVAISRHIPLFGTSELQGYPIRVRVSENCYDYPDTFMAIMVHELSHVLLASLWSTRKDSELHADLAPIVLGFGGLVRRGRKTIETTTEGNTRITRTTTYGYLTDPQFRFARKYVAKVLQRRVRDKKRLLALVGQVQTKLKAATRSLATFRDYFSYIDSHPPERMREEHAERVVLLYGKDHTGQWEAQITACEARLQAAKTYVHSLTPYTSGAMERLESHTQALERVSDELDHVTEGIADDVRVLSRYVGVLYKLRRTLWPHPLRSDRR